MRLRVAFALMPVLFVPACVATHAFEIWRAKVPVARQPSGEFPLLQIKGKAVHIVRYAARDPQATFLLPPSVQQQLDAQHKPDDPDVMYAEVDFENLRRGLQRVHVRTAHELAMGYIRTESWYDTDGKSIVPRFEREYLPTWKFLWACIVAIPVTMIAATASLPLVPSIRPAPPAALTCAIIAVVLYAIAAMQIGAMKPNDFALLPIVAAAAYVIPKIKWTKWLLAITIVVATAIPVALTFFSGEAGGVAVLCELALVAFTAAAALIERSLRYALTTAPTTS